MAPNEGDVSPDGMAAMGSMLADLTDGLSGLDDDVNVTLPLVG